MEIDKQGDDDECEKKSESEETENTISGSTDNVTSTDSIDTTTSESIGSGAFRKKQIKKLDSTTPESLSVEGSEIEGRFKYFFTDFFFFCHLFSYFYGLLD